MAARAFCRHFVACCLGLLAAAHGASSLVAESAKAPAVGTPATGTPGTGAAAAPADTSPKITDLRFTKLDKYQRDPKSELPKEVTFTLAILGENLPCDHPAPKVTMATQDPGQPVEVQEIVVTSAQEIDVSGHARVGTVITSVTVTGDCKATAAAAAAKPAPEAPAMANPFGTVLVITPAVTPPQDMKGGCQAVTGQGGAGKGGSDKSTGAPGNSATSKGLTITVKAIPRESVLQSFTVAFDHQVSHEFPNLHSLVATKQSGELGVGFCSNPNHMRIDLEPTGATDLTVVQSNEEQLDLHFVAAADYVPTNLVVTVYNGSDLDARRAIFIGKVAAAAKAPAKDDANAPAIASVETVFVDRHEGNGRIRVYGKGFGKSAAPPPFPVDEFLCDCLERPPQVLVEPPRPRTCGHFASRFIGSLDTASDLALQEAARRDYCGIDGNGNLIAGGRLMTWWTWRCGVTETAGIYGRNAGIRVEKAEIIDANDEMVDLYFEFSRHRGYAWPFQLAGVDLTVPTTGKKVEQTVTSPDAKATAEVDAAVSSIAHLSSTIGAPPDENLTFRYTVLSDQEVGHLLGEGVAKNFHVIQLAVVNDGAKKVAVPLAGMQAEVEWLYGPAPQTKETETRPGAAAVKQTKDFFLEGPPTLAPVPMPVVSAYFGASKKSTEPRTKVFNFLEGVTTFVGELVPYAGVGLKDAAVVFSSGFIPGLRHAWADITDQQLQNLTTLSWQTSEMLAADGGTAEKLIFIQKGQQFSDEDEPISDPPSKTRQQLSNIMGLEVAGYEIADSPAKQATPAGKSPATNTKTKSSTSTTKTAPSGATKISTTTTESTPPPQNP
jgi:hypothetical protein